MPSPIVQIRIPQELLDQAKAQAKADRRSLSAWVRLLIEDRLRAPKFDPAKDDLYTPCSECGGLAPFEDPFDGLCVRCYMKEGVQDVMKQQKPASVAQPGTEHRSPKPGDERSNRSRRAGKGRGSGTAAAESRAVGSGKDADQVVAQPAGPSRKPKACKHTNQIRKLGRPYCTDCGEFV